MKGLMRQSLSGWSPRRFLLLAAICCSLQIYLEELYSLLPSGRQLLASVRSKYWNPHSPWCPYAVCENSNACKPCERRFILIIGSPDSGSTALRKLLNRLPGVRIGGENNDQMYKAAQMDFNLRYNGAYFMKRQVVGPWMHNPIPERSFACPLQEMFEAINPPAPMIMNNVELLEQDKETIVGFATTRFLKSVGQKHWTLERSATFIKNNFPCSKIIMTLNFSENDMEKQLNNGKLESLRKTFNGRQAMILDDSKWYNPDEGLETINNLVEWLGFDDCYFSKSPSSQMTDWKDNFDGWDNVKMNPECRRIWI